MKLFIATLLIVFASVTESQGQKKLDLTSPFEEIKSSYNDATKEVTILVKLREAGATTVATGLQSKFSIKKVRVVSDNVTGVVQPNPRPDPDSLIYTFNIPINQATQVATNDANNVFRLGRDWKRLQYAIEYSFTADGLPNANSVEASTASLEIQKYLIDPSKSKMVDSIISNAVWSGGADIYVPIKITGEELFVEVQLLESGREAAKGGQIFGRGQTDQNVKLEICRTCQISTLSQYTIKLSAPSRPDVTFSQPELANVNVSNSFGYAINRDSITNLGKVRITYALQNASFDVFTTIPGNLSMVLDNGQEIKGTKDNNKQTFTLQPANFVDFPDGPIGFHFVGSSGGQQLVDSAKHYSIIKDTSTKIVGVSRISLDNNNFLHFTYSLSRKMDNEVQISGSDIRTVANPAPTADEPNRYEAQINLGLATNRDNMLKLVTNSGANKTPITFQVFVVGDGLATRQPIGGIAVDAVNLGATSAISATTTQAIATAAQQLDKKKEDQARQTISTALNIINPVAGSTEQQTIDSLIDLLKSKKGSNKVLSVLSVVGRMAATYFGIPIPAK